MEQNLPTFPLSRRTILTGAFGVAGIWLVGCTPTDTAPSAAPGEPEPASPQPGEPNSPTSGGPLLTRPVTELASGVYQISDYKLVSYYLIIGSTKAALIDAGAGLDDPWPDIKKLTDKPVTLLLTHGHPDHIGNAYYFDEIWMNNADKELATKYNDDVEGFKDYVRTRTPRRNPGEGHAEFLESLVPDTRPPMFEFSDLVDGQQVDLGDRTLEIIATPGHTPGSLSILDGTSRLLITGDALNESSIIPNKEGGTRDEIAAMAATLRKMQAREADFDQTCPGHDGTTLDKQLISDFLYLCDGLLDGSLVGEYEESGIRAGKVVRQGMAELWYEADK